MASSISNLLLSSNLCSSNNSSSLINLSRRKERKTSTRHHLLVYTLSKNLRPKRLDLSPLRTPLRASSSSKSLLRISWQTNRYNSPTHKKCRPERRARSCCYRTRSKTTRGRGATSGSSSTRLGNSSSSSTTARSNSSAISKTLKASSNVTKTWRTTLVVWRSS